MKKVLVGMFLALFGVAMANVTLANHENVMCTMQYDPVCGTDGKTYGNSCVANAAHATVAYAGECKAPTTGDKACTKEYKPVCGFVQVQCIKAPCYPVAQTFGNRCEAENADAMNITEGACAPNTTYNRLANTSWKLSAFDGQAVTGEHTLKFTDDQINAKVCNHKSGSYEVSGNVINITKEGMTTTLMLCMAPVGEYEAHFDLSGAKYELSTDGANHLMITTVSGHTYQWTSTKMNPSKPTQPSNNSSWRRYGLIIRQLNQLAKLKGYDTVAEKQAMAQSLLDKINQIMIVSLMTPGQNAKWVFLKNAIQYYHDHIADGTFKSL